MTAILALIGLPVVGGSVLGIAIGLLRPTRLKLSVNVLKAALRGAKRLRAPDRAPTLVEIETMQRMDIFH